MNNPQTVEELVKNLAMFPDQDILLEDQLIDYDAFNLGTIMDIITQDRLAHKTALLEAIGNYDTKEHICGFNDGDCDCECFLAGLDTMTDIINKTFE